jgi:hypothetical protein
MNRHPAADYAYPATDYGAMAQRYWQEWLPQRYAAITDPDSFFGRLSADVSHEIAELSGQMSAAHGNPPGEDFTDRVGRLNATRKQAEEIVLADLVLLPPEGEPKTRTRHDGPRLAGASGRGSCG